MVERCGLFKKYNVMPNKVASSVTSSMYVYHYEVTKKFVEVVL
jgi:hypothetical protein